MLSFFQLNDTEQYLRYAHGLISEYISEDLSKALFKHLEQVYKSIYDCYQCEGVVVIHTKRSYSSTPQATRDHKSKRDRTSFQGIDELTLHSILASLPLCYALISAAPYLVPACFRSHMVLSHQWNYSTFPNYIFKFLLLGLLPFLTYFLLKIMFEL